ncbi:MAG: hypothetical protein ACYC61_22020 [Isosphaeraceae bacterium]
MPISFACPKCGKKLRAPDDAVGKSSRCPGCGTVVTCPEPILDAELIDPIAAGEPAFSLDESPQAGSASLPFGGLADGSSSPSPVAAEEARRPCPICGEMIVVGAAKCRFCGEVFDESIRKAQSRGRRVDENLTTGDILIGLFCGWIGCIAGIVWMIQGKPKGWKMVLISLVSWFLGMILWSFFSQTGGLPR